jgi:flavin reductase (DIM6/NTAB) family NADH-FMN oxidoreductase RutF
MKQIDCLKLTDNFIDSIGNEWMLVTAGTAEKFNTMTASWGGTGYLWNKPVVFVFVRPERYTHEFIEKQTCFTLSFLGEEHKAIHKICGSTSGREVDKVKEAGLTPIITKLGNVAVEHPRLTLECKKLYTDMLKEDSFFDHSLFEKWYGAKGTPHQVYVAEIISAWEK